MGAPSLTVQVNGGSPVTADNLNTYEQTCDTVAELRSFIGVSGVQVYARGYSSPGDGGQGVFYWNATGAAADDGGVTTVVPNGSGSGEWTRISGDATASGYSATRTVPTGSSDSASLSDTLIIWYSTTASVKTQTIPAATSKGKTFIIKDGVGTAYPYNIVITPASGTIDSLSSYTINNNKQSVTLKADGISNWVVV